MVSYCSRVCLSYHSSQGDDENHQVGAILWRINMLYPIMALIVDLDCDLVGIAVFIRIKSLRYHWYHRAKSNLKLVKRM